MSKAFRFKTREVEEQGRGIRFGLVMSQIVGRRVTYRQLIGDTDPESQTTAPTA
jgi:hypothetical protein